MIQHHVDCGVVKLLANEQTAHPHLDLDHIIEIFLATNFLMGLFRYLSLGNLRDANGLMDEVKKQMLSKELDFPQSELIQFINYLLLTLQRDALPLFNMLRQNYKSSIEREPIFHELLDEIAEKFYGVRRRNPLQGMFGDIFKMMGGE